MTTPDINKILKANPRSCTYGAPLGYHHHNDSDSELYCQRVRIDAGGYAPDNTYWGHGETLWCAFNGEDDKFAPAMGTRAFVRAGSMAEAISKFDDQYGDNVTFVKLK
jgi:hypothetical protein